MAQNGSNSRVPRSAAKTWIGGDGSVALDVRKEFGRPPQDLRIIVALVRLAQPPKSRTYDNLQVMEEFPFSRNKHWLQWVQLLEHLDRTPFRRFRARAQKPLG